MYYLKSKIRVESQHIVPHTGRRVIKIRVKTKVKNPCGNKTRVESKRIVPNTGRRVIKIRVEIKNPCGIIHTTRISLRRLKQARIYRRRGIKVVGKTTKLSFPSLRTDATPNK